ncbi:hypothetical protein BH11MYX2_BH11MYX2_35700 [soil metagenome]
MRYLLTPSLLVGAAALGTQLSACGGGGGGGGGGEAFDNLQDCFADHHLGAESLPIQESITVCCLEHPIAGQDANVVCGATADTCKTYVSANLDGAAASGDDINAACADYETKRNE